MSNGAIRRIIVIGRKMVERMEVLTTPEAERAPPKELANGPAACRCAKAKWEVKGPLCSGRRGNAERKALIRLGLDMSVVARGVVSPLLSSLSVTSEYG